MVKVRGNPPGKSPGYLTSQEESFTTAGVPQYFLLFTVITNALVRGAVGVTSSDTQTS